MTRLSRLWPPQGAVHDQADWSSLRAWIAEQVATLPAGHLVDVVEKSAIPPELRDGHGPGVRNRYVRLRNTISLMPPPHRHARIVVLGPELVEARLTGADTFGGPLHLEVQVLERIRSLGWLVPGDPGYQGVSAHARRARSGTSFYYGSPTADAGRIAGLTTMGLEFLGADIAEIGAGVLDYAHWWPSNAG